MKSFGVVALASIIAQSSAVTLSLWTNNRACNGEGAVCSSLARNTCCYGSRTDYGSVQYGGIHPAGSVMRAYQAVGGNRCGNSVFGDNPIPANGANCAYTYPSAGSLAGTQWVVAGGSRRRDLREDGDDKNCTTVLAEPMWSDGATAWIISHKKGADMEAAGTAGKDKDADVEKYYKQHADKIVPLWDE